MTTEAPSPKQLRVEHHTRYAYAENVFLSYHQAMLEPRDAERQQVASKKLRVEPPVRVATGRQDYFGNHVSVFEIETGHRTLDVIAESQIVINTGRPPELSASFSIEEISRRLLQPEDDALLAASEHLASSPFIPRGPDLAALARPHFSAPAALSGRGSRADGADQHHVCL